MTQKYYDTKFKKCIILNQKIVAIIFEEEKFISSIYKNENDVYKTKKIYYNNFLKIYIPSIIINLYA